MNVIHTTAYDHPIWNDVSYNGVDYTFNGNLNSDWMAKQRGNQKK
jgi:hypothetical protein